MKKAVVGLFLIVLVCSLLFVATNVDADTFQGWEVEEGGGHYSESDGVIRLWGTVGSNESVVLYKEIDPETDFEFSLQVNATTLAGFAIMLRSSLPFVGSTQGVNLEFGARDNGTVLLARWVSSWTWNIFVTDIENNTWYTLKLGVHKSPFNITAEAFSDNGTLLGFYSASDMTNLSFDDIEYLGFGVLESGGDYAVRNFNFSGISRTWIVDSEGFGDATSIQTAIDNASAEDTIFVRQGTYYEHLTVNKTLTLMGENRANTIIDAGGTEPASVVVVSASNVVIRGFTIQNSRSGGNAIWIDGVFNNTIKDNVIQKNGDGTRILHSSGNLILDNYFINNTHTAIGFDWSTTNSVFNNTILNNHIGVGASYDVNSTIFSNNTMFANDNGILVAMNDCKFFYNNIMDNNVQAQVYYNLTNQWDDGYALGGNYWSDYSGSDANGDGIGDSPYIIDGNNIDYYPLMKEYGAPVVRFFNVTVGDTDFGVRTFSNSIVSNLSFNQTLKQLSLSVSGTAGSTGFCHITVPAELMSGDFTLYLDDVLLVEGVDYAASSNATHYFFNVYYEHSSHVIKLVSTEVIPDFAGWLFLPFILLAIMSALILKKKLRK